MKIYLAEKLDFIDGYWGHSFSARKAFKTKQDAIKYIAKQNPDTSIEELLKFDWRVREIELE